MIARIGVILALLTAPISAASGPRIILGVLEDKPGHYAGEAHYRTVRAVFEKQDSAWKALQADCHDQACLKTSTDKYPEQLTWIIAIDGKHVGSVTTRRPKDFRWYSSIGEQEIISSSSVPTIGQRSVEFGWDSAVYRPLIANSKPYYRDPDTWKPSTVSPNVLASLRQVFRDKFPELCTWSEQENKLESLVYRNEDVHLTKSYASKSGWIVARLHLPAIDCRDVEAGNDIDDPWFVVDPTQHISYLDSGMWLVDAGDYDNDGQSELIFLISQDNRGGYEIFYDQFKRHTVFEFGFH